MDQTSTAEIHNPDLLKIIPVTAKRLVEVGCSSGALAREFKKVAPSCDYLGIEIDAERAEQAKRYCDRSLALDIEQAEEAFWQACADRDCWIFGDVLEHLRDPWQVLRNIRSVIPPDGVLAVCIPNAQHWTVQVRLNIGDFRYEELGLLDKTHLRWFTRKTIFELMQQTGFQVIKAYTRVFAEPKREKFLPIIGEMAKLAGADPSEAIADAIPFQYVITAAPK